MALARHLSKDEGYTPTVPSPLNPTSCYQIQTKQPRQQGKVRVLGRTSPKQSLTESLLRHKAAVAFHDHILVFGRPRVAQQHVVEAGEKKSLVSASGPTRSPSSAVPYAHLGSRRLHNPDDPSISRRRETRDLFSLEIEEATGRRHTDEFYSTSSGVSAAGLYPEEDGDKMQLMVAADGSEFLVDFSGVTIDSITTAVLMPRRRAFFAAWTTPSRMLWALALVSFLLILLFVRLQVMLTKYLTP